MRLLRAVSIVAVLLVIAANACALLPGPNVLQPYLSQPYFAYGVLALGVIALITMLASWPRRREIERAPATAVQPLPVAAHKSNAEAEVVSFLATLQASGRLVDFLMDDINGVDDAGVGAAARVVHAGCKTALLEHFQIRPVRRESEGSTVKVEAGYPADEYRLLGKISGQAPFSGVLVHHGWKTDSVKLPRVLHGATDRLPTIAPAEVELK